MSANLVLALKEHFCVTSDEQLGRALGVSTSTIRAWKYELRKPSAQMVDYLEKQKRAFARQKAAKNGK